MDPIELNDYARIISQRNNARQALADLVAAADKLTDCGVNRNEYASHNLPYITFGRENIEVKSVWELAEAVERARKVL